jgi:glutamate carboxypeptidase
LGDELMNYQELKAHLVSLRSDMVQALRELVERESPSDDKPLLDALAGYLQGRFAGLAAEAAILPHENSGNGLRVVAPPQSVSWASPPALLLCHMDTVWPAGTLAARPFRVEEGRAYGPGTYDMKSGIVIAEFALRAIRDLDLRLPRPVLLLVTADEEIGSKASRPLIEELAQRSQYVLVLEPALATGALKTARKGVGRFVVEIEGRAAHAGVEPEKGISAVKELAHQILYLQGLADPAQGTTLNVGVVRGGTRTNVVAAYAEAQVDVRVWSMAEAERVAAAIKDIQPYTPGIQLRARGGFARPPMERTTASAVLFRRAQEIGRYLGLDLGEASTGGGSDANFTAALGISTLDGLGAVGDGGHADHEHVLVDSLPERAALLAALLVNL